MEQIARSVVPVVDSRAAHCDSGLLVLLYHPVVRHVVEEFLHFEIRQGGDFCEAAREDGLLRPRGYDHRLSFIPCLLKCRFEGILATPVPEDSLRHFVSLDSLYFNAYNVAGDCYLSSGRPVQAATSYRHALTLPMKLSEYHHIETKLQGIK